VHIHPATDIHDLWGVFSDFARTAPDTIAAIFTVALAEPAADYPDDVAGRPIVLISYNHSGAGEDVERDIAPLLRGPKPASVTAIAEPYLTTQRSSDLTLAWGSRSFILGTFVADCPPDVLDAYAAHVENVPGDSSISITMMGGAIDRVPDDAAAFTGRGHAFDVSPDTAWADPAHDDENAEWVRRAMAIVEPHAVPGRYINELSDASAEITRASYGDGKLRRLRALKREWDPSNTFRLNHNIEPADA
jgi:hypothetical protein